MTGAGLRVMCLSNMAPGPRDPDYGIFVHDMCEALRRRGHDVDEVVIRSRRAGPILSPLKYGRLGARAIAHAARADVIYAHYLFPTGAIAAVAGHAHGVPWVLTAHGQDVRNLERPSIRRASRPGIEGAARLIPVSDYLRSQLAEHELALPRVDVVNMGVDLNRFGISDRSEAKSALGLDADAPLILAVGGLTERKNPIRLLRALPRLRETRDARLAFVGDGPLAEEIDAIATDLEIADSVIRPGAIPHDEIPGWMAACDVLSLVSEVEPLGQVALEALASGRPVVATSVGGTREIVPQSGAGRHVDPTDVQAIADALADVLDHPPRAEECRRAAEPFSLERNADRVAEILATAAAG